MSEKKQPANKSEPRTTAEWVSLGIALLLLAGLIGTVIFLWQQFDNAPSSFEIQRAAIYDEGGQFYLPITVINRGNLAAQQVTVQGTLAVSDTEEISEITFDFIPPQAQASGVLIFTHEPQQAEIRVISFEQSH
jgi:uncharacterized protein (TIGR02588 family)